MPEDKVTPIDKRKQRDAFQTEKMEEVEKAYEAVKTIESKIKTLTEEKALIYAKLTDAGFCKKGLTSARKVSDMSETDQELFDNTLVFARHVLKRPLSNTLLAGSINAAFLKSEDDGLEKVEG